MNQVTLGKTGITVPQNAFVRCRFSVSVRTYAVKLLQQSI